MNTGELTQSFTMLLRELVQGAPDTGAFILNPHDPGLLASLDRLSAEEASVAHNGGASIAAHVDHLRYGLSLMNRWATGENPFEDADWTASWDKLTVSDAEWKQRCAALRDEAERWITTVEQPREVNQIELTGMVASIAHLAYHFGAVRQMDRRLRGPSAKSE